jgi:hypothetical protein
MGKLRAATTFGLGAQKSADSSVFTVNHFISSTPVPPALKQKIASMGLERIAGNIYESPSTRDFWKVKGNSIIKLVGDEVDNGESIAAAPKNDPMGFMGAFDDIEF